MGMNFTPEQQKVIELHNSNILVSAAAGSGKTAVLVERIIRMICEGEHPADIDRLLIVTFTNAAAAEMRERIAAGIAARLEADPGNDHIQKQSALLHNAQITTIDSFSLFLIRNHFNEIGLDPDFRVADEGEIKLLQQEVLGQLLEDAYAGKFVPDDVPTSRENRDSGAMIPKEASGNDFAEEVPGKRDSGDPSREARERFHACVEYFCPGGRESVLEQHILNLSRYAGSFPWPAEWLEERKNDYAAGDLDALLHSDYGQYLAERVSRVLQGCLEKLVEVKKLCELPDGPYMYGELTEAESEQLERLAACKDLKEQAAKVPAVTFGRLSSKKDESVDPAKRELAKSIRNSVKDTLADLTEQYFKTPLELVVEQGKACREPLRMLLNLVLEFDRRLLAAKQERHLIDFSDMEHYALQILLKREKVEETGDAGTDSAGDTGMDSTGVKYDIVPSDVALEYRQYFQEILIDEYQDSNLVQEYLLSAISGEAEGHYNRFMVGDVKQSIYKFRLARPELFLEKYDTTGGRTNGTVRSSAGSRTNGARHCSAGSRTDGIGRHTAGIRIFRTRSRDADAGSAGSGSFRSGQRSAGCGSRTNDTGRSSESRGARRNGESGDAERDTKPDRAGRSGKSGSAGRNGGTDGTGRNTASDGTRRSGKSGGANRRRNNR